jgi:predicted AAA+ superfamily ATPase
MEYNKRFIDKLLAERLKSSGAVLIEGAKGCGKTETARQLAVSEVRLDLDEQAKIKFEIDPGLILQGPTPRLLDEWQVYPQIWNYIRHEVDDRQKKGQFILTGSARPTDRVKRHSGAGRFSILTMRPMSLYERGWSTGEVSLAGLLNGELPSSEEVNFNLEDLAEKLTMGGWPGLIGQDNQAGLQFSKDYVSLVAQVYLSRVSEKRRDPRKVKRLLQSLARNISTEVTITALSKEARGSEGTFNDQTAAEYLEALERLKILEQLPAYHTHIRSRDSLRKSPKRHFVDPSLAIGALDLSVDKLLADLNYFQRLLESLVIRDLRILASFWGGDIFHYRDSAGLKIDSVIEKADGSWGAFEIKLGFGAATDAANKILTLAAKIDTNKTKAPSSLTVITTNGFAHRRPDGVNVVPLSTLTL